MQIVIHIGAHETDNGCVIQTLREHQGSSISRLLEVPDPLKYLDLIEGAKKNLNGHPASKVLEDSLLAMILETDHTERLVLGSENFLSWPHNIWIQGEFFPNAARNIKLLRMLFPSFSVEFNLIVRNPFSFINALQKHRKNKRLREELLHVNPINVSWFQTIKQIARAVPDCKIHVWRFEALAVDWPKMIKALAVFPENTPVQITEQTIENFLNPRGKKYFLKSLSTNPPSDESKLFERFSSYVLVHGKERAEEIITTSQIWEMTEENYQDDILRLKEIPNVLIRAC